MFPLWSYDPQPFGINQILLGGSWVVISELRSRRSKVISIVTLLITLLITTHEPPSKPEALLPHEIPFGDGLEGEWEAKPQLSGLPSPSSINPQP